MNKKYQGNIFGNWLPIEKIIKIEKNEKKYYSKKENLKIRLINLYGQTFSK